MEATTGPCMPKRNQSSISIIFLYIRVLRLEKSPDLWLHGKHLADTVAAG